MSRKTLRLKDGFNSSNPHLRDEVKILQKALVKAGYPTDTDGFFGDGTESAVKKFQAAKGLKADGIVGKGSWSKLGFEEATSHVEIPSGVMVGFRGDLGFIHAREGHRGYPYWPGGASGVTLDPGFDLGHVEPETFAKYYKEIFTTDEMAALKPALGVKGNDAKSLYSNHPEWKKIKVSSDEAGVIFPVAADKYWKGITRRYPVLKDADTPGSVQTAYLSLAYNRGTWNKGLNVMADALNTKNWVALADELGNMQQDHKLEGIRKRRRMEADLIRNEVT